MQYQEAVQVWDRGNLSVTLNMCLSIRTNEKKILSDKFTVKNLSSSTLQVTNQR